MSAAYYKVHGRTLASAPGDDMSSTEIRRPDASGSEYVQKVFSSMDLDHDGTLSVAELEAGLRAIRESRGMGRVGGAAVAVFRRF